MKKLAIITVTFFFAMSAIQASARKDGKSMNKDLNKVNLTEKTVMHKPGGSNINEMSEETFMNDFPNVHHVQWKINGIFDEARFIKNGKNMTAYYNDDGDLVGTTKEAEFSDLPSRCRKTINKEYKKYKIGPVIYFKDNQDNINDLILYGVQIHSPESWLVELKGRSENIVVQAFRDGQVSYYTRMTS